MNILRYQCDKDHAILGSNVKEYLGEFKPAANMSWLEETCCFNRCKLLGKHNQANIEAAFLESLQYYGSAKDNAARSGSQFFPHCPHRLELVGEIDGTTFIK